MIKRLFIDEAYNQARKSIMNCNHGAVVIHRGKIVGRGYNTYIDSNYKRSIHAEEKAISESLKRLSESDLKKCELIIIRINNQGEYLDSKPCANCSKLIQRYSIKKVFYSCACVNHNNGS